MRTVPQNERNPGPRARSRPAPDTSSGLTAAHTQGSLEGATGLSSLRTSVRNSRAVGKENDLYAVNLTPWSDDPWSLEMMSSVVATSIAMAPYAPS